MTAFEQVIAIGSFFGWIAVGFMNYLAASKATKRAEAARIAAEEAKIVNVATHTLVNSRSGAMMLVLAIALERIAAQPDATEDDKFAAVSARKDYLDHMRKQSVVDTAAAAAAAAAK